MHRLLSASTGDRTAFCDSHYIKSARFLVWTGRRGKDKEKGLCHRKAGNTRHCVGYARIAFKLTFFRYFAGLVMHTAVAVGSKILPHSKSQLLYLFWA